jgi:hypothetical protein
LTSGCRAIEEEEVIIIVTIVMLLMDFVPYDHLPMASYVHVLLYNAATYVFTC